MSDDRHYSAGGYANSAACAGPGHAHDPRAQAPSPYRPPPFSARRYRRPWMGRLARALAVGAVLTVAVYGAYWHPGIAAIVLIGASALCIFAALVRWIATGET